MKIIIISLIISGCGSINHFKSTVTGWYEVCVHGVTYLQFTSGAAVLLDASGKPVICT